jgi:hypothetical protein
MAIGRRELLLHVILVRFLNNDRPIQVSVQSNQFTFASIDVNRIDVFEDEKFYLATLPNRMSELAMDTPVCVWLALTVIAPLQKSSNILAILFLRAANAFVFADIGTGAVYRPPVDSRVRFVDAFDDDTCEPILAENKNLVHACSFSCGIPRWLGVVLADHRSLQFASLQSG